MTVKLTMTEAAEAAGGRLRQRGACESFKGVAIDSRAVQHGAAFVAIVGENHDGHDFWRQAVELGAALLVISRDLEEDPPGEVAVLVVDDTRAALGSLAREWRRRVSPKVVAITGSVGKTTTKELTRHLLARLGPTHCNPGNYNNDIGLPLTLLSMPVDARYLVTEMGMNAPGEIAALTRVAEPDVGVITCVAPVHLEGLGSIEAVAAAKGELLEGLRAGGWAVVPIPEPLLEPALGSVERARQIRFGADEGAQVRIARVESQGEAGCLVELDIRGSRVHTRLPLVGRYNAYNAAAAAAVAAILGMSPEEIAGALASAPAGFTHRSALIEVGPWRILDDCYNANPVAMKAALDTLVQLAGRAPRIAVLGEMLELGDAASSLHEEVGRHAAGLDLTALVTVGSLGACIARGARGAGMAPGRIVEVESPDAACRVVSELAPGGWLLVKASRGNRLERVIERLKERAESAPGGAGDQ